MHRHVTFIGIAFNSKRKAMEVTPEWMRKIQDLAKRSKNKWATCTRREIQLLVGKLQFIAKWCKYGCCFMPHILAGLKSLMHAPHSVCLNKEFKQDIKWWQCFLHFNSISVIKTGQWAQADIIITTDACLPFPEELKDRVSRINQLEAIAVIITLKLWGYCSKDYSLS